LSVVVFSSYIYYLIVQSFKSCCFQGRRRS